MSYLPTPPSGRPSLRPMSLAVARMWIASYNRAIERVHQRCRVGTSDGLPLDWEEGGLVMDSAVPKSCLAFSLPGQGQWIGYICPAKRFKPLGEMSIRLGRSTQSKASATGTSHSTSSASAFGGPDGAHPAAAGTASSPSRWTSR